ncbi:metal ABC transporter permease [Streptomyces sp. NPDC020379]|uniref:metal ABC transporter permease n=1 Tax=Streptomyces sp. NPDC020379 TaxID=3365071 RepID=UPI003790D75F
MGHAEPRSLTWVRRGPRVCGGRGLAVLLQHALLGGTLIAAACGLVGYFLVLRAQVFTADALSHVAFTGAMAALAFGSDLCRGRPRGRCARHQRRAALPLWPRPRPSPLPAVYRVRPQPARRIRPRGEMAGPDRPASARTAAGRPIRRRHRRQPEGQWSSQCPSCWACRCPSWM